MGLPKKVLAACRVLGIRPNQVIAHGFREESVVIIEGPVGHKRVVTPEQIEAFEAGEKAEAAAIKAAKKEEARAKAEAKKEAKAKAKAEAEVKAGEGK